MEIVQNIPLIPAQVLQNLSSQQAWSFRVVPKEVDGNSMLLYSSETHWNSNLRDEMEVLIGKNIQAELIADELLSELLSKYYRRQKKVDSVALSDPGRSDDFLINIIREANSIGSSDIHLESYEDSCRIRLRIDGKLMEKYILKRDEYPALINKVKIKARLDISEKRLPQDGRIQIHDEDAKFDIRVSIIPTLFGEKIVLRLLSRDATEIDIVKLGFDDKQLADYLQSIRKSHGIVLISGPTGSGKTTTLYASLKILNNNDTNILTIEDPVEYTLKGINQVQLKEDIGLDFTAALRSFLRQDPDIIMLGEIRDEKTASMAIRAALTGHLVLSTIHTNSAWGTVSRLTDMGLPPYLIASTMNATVAQRLVRLLCPKCKARVRLTEADWSGKVPGPNIDFHYKAHGCDACHFTGYSGRRALYEVIPVSKELADMIRNGDLNIDNWLKQNKIKRLSDQAGDLLAEGLTSLEEVYNLLLE